MSKKTKVTLDFELTDAQIKMLDWIALAPRNALRYERDPDNDPDFYGAEWRVLEALISMGLVKRTGFGSVTLTPTGRRVLMKCP